MVGQVHVCVFDVGSDECLICGTRAALVGQQTLHKMQPSWKRALQGVAEQVPRSRREWAHKPHFSRLICICVGCLVVIILLVAFAAVATSLDADECTAGSHGCDENADCTNLDGTYTCDCRVGYIGSGRECYDIDECLDTVSPPPDCHAKATCSNLPGSFACICNKGYMGTGRHCVDVDECTADNGGCGDPLYHHCVNRIGEQNLCEDVLECAHNNGACGNATLVLCEERNGMKPNCRDINECAVNNGGCGRGFRCVNRDGRVGQVHECHDLNECVDGTHLCSAHANCTNTPVGSYSCNCTSGYAGTGRHCVDINECDAANGGCDMFCLNHDGGYSCACASRFRLRADGLACDDIDECTADNGGCGPAQFFTCTNQLGAPAQCSGGYPACAAGSGPSQLYRDCNGACFTAELTNLGDQFCDDGAGIPNLNCSDWRFDSGDC